MPGRVAAYYPRDGIVPPMAKGETGDMMRQAGIVAGICLGAGFAGLVLTAPLPAAAQNTGTTATEPQGPPAPQGATSGQPGTGGQSGEHSDSQHEHHHHHHHHEHQDDKGSEGSGTVPSQGQQH